MSDIPLPEPLDEFLNHPPARPEPAELRGELLRRTSGLVRRRRLVRRLAAVGAMSAALLLAALAWWLYPPPPPGPPLLDQPQAKQPPAPEPPAPRPPEEKPPPAPAPAAPALPPAVALEWKAFDAPRPQKAALYVQAGDRYVEDDSDLASALRCYGQAVQTASAGELRIDPDDNWLVMALKLDQIERRKEK
jgi:hypothetical protein